MTEWKMEKKELEKLDRNENINDKGAMVMQRNGEEWPKAKVLRGKAWGNAITEMKSPHGTGREDRYEMIPAS